jgi:ABC-type uncharacterized transport system substrate-binding protein
VVFSVDTDPVKTGLVAALNPPGANVSGITQFPSVEAKRLEILREAFPSAGLITSLVNPSFPPSKTKWMRSRPRPRRWTAILMQQEREAVLKM